MAVWPACITVAPPMILALGDTAGATGAGVDSGAGADSGVGASLVSDSGLGSGSGSGSLSALGATWDAPSGSEAGVGTGAGSGKRSRSTGVCAGSEVKTGAALIAAAGSSAL